MTEPDDEPGGVTVDRSLVDTSDPAPWFALMRRREPVWHDERFGMWHVFRHADVEAALTDHATFSSDSRAAMAAMPEFQPFTRGNFMVMDPPDHRRLRGLVSAAFGRRAMERLEPLVTAIVDDLLDEVKGAEEIDLVTALAHPMPVFVLADLLGLPRADRPTLFTWAKVLTGVDITAGAAPADPASSLREMNAYLLEVVAGRRRAPGDDLVSRLVQAEVDGDRLADDELVGIVSLLLIAGHLMATMLVANTVLCLDGHPEAAARVRADPEGLLPGAIEETLRYRNSADRLVRTATRDVELAGRAIPAGARVLLWTGSANRDPAAFTEPDRFDVTRTPNRHLGFGQGVHFCLGAPLGRLEARVALGRMLARMPSIEVLSGVEYFGSHSLIRKVPLRVRWV
ncbi:cytochrome P450 [Sphaerisporangium melleum]|uniref:Cytochrome P450 n=1 Tax=Sphaerisporangium melleum TaxID=321316 RepID=A0A917VGH5_9ACTN|nr:cytochrome P450 [Sphaerisporangium melleum]GGK78175.1 cytochrome P450 [Sphaerisporangium melleum]GII71943.1 cytochrome P450 [Sphaerisporangium melleum]